MIVPYVGKGWYLDKDMKKVDCTYTKDDRMVHGVCDLCGEVLRDEDDEGQSLFDSRGLVHELAQDYDWAVLGDHLVCPNCRGLIERGELKIRLVREGGRK